MKLQVTSQNHLFAGDPCYALDSSTDEFKGFITEHGFAIFENVATGTWITDIEHSNVDWLEHLTMYLEGHQYTFSAWIEWQEITVDSGTAAIGIIPATYSETDRMDLYDNEFGNGIFFYKNILAASTDDGRYSVEIQLNDNSEIVAVRIIFEEEETCYQCGMCEAYYDGTYCWDCYEEIYAEEDEEDHWL